MNTRVHSPIPKDALLQWLSSGGSPLYIQGNAGSCTTVIALSKAEEFDYLFCTNNYNGPTVCRNDQFKFCGLFSRTGRALYLMEYLSDKVEGLTPEECMDGNALGQQFSSQVDRRVEDIIAGDRRKLAVRELSRQDLKRSLEYFQKHGAEEEAIQRLFAGEDEEIQFHGEYSFDGWNEDSLLAYLENSEAFIQAEAEAYIQSHQDELLKQFLENDALRAACGALKRDTGNPIHRKKAISDAVTASGAKTVTVTVRKDAHELTFKTSADSLSGRYAGYSLYAIAASDRQEFEKMFGRFADYRPEDVIKITYGKKTIYESPPVEDMAEKETPQMGMGGMSL